MLPHSLLPNQLLTNIYHTVNRLRSFLKQPQARSKILKEMLVRMDHALAATFRRPGVYPSDILCTNPSSMALALATFLVSMVAGLAAWLAVKLNQTNGRDNH